MTQCLFFLPWFPTLVRNTFDNLWYCKNALSIYSYSTSNICFGPFCHPKMFGYGFFPPFYINLLRSSVADYICRHLSLSSVHWTVSGSSQIAIWRRREYCIWSELNDVAMRVWIYKYSIVRLIQNSISWVYAKILLNNRSSWCMLGVI